MFFDDMLETAEVIEDYKQQSTGVSDHPQLDKLDQLLKTYAFSPLNPGNIRVFDFEVAKVIMPYYFIPAVGKVDLFEKEDAYLFALRGFGQQEFFNVTLFNKNPAVALLNIAQTFKRPGF